MPSSIALPAYSAPADLPISPVAATATVDVEEERRRAQRIAAAAAQWQGMGIHGSTGVVFAPRSIPAPENSIFVVAKLAKIRSEPALLDAYKSLLKFPATVAVSSSNSSESRRVCTVKSSVRSVHLAVDEWDSLAGRPRDPLALRVRINRQSSQEDDAIQAPSLELVGGDAFDLTPSSSAASTVRSLASILPNSPHSSIQDALNNLDDLTTNDLLPETHPADDRADATPQDDQDQSLDAMDPARLPPPPPRYECATGTCARRSSVSAVSPDALKSSKRKPSFQALLPGLQPGMADALAGDEYPIGHARITTVVADYKSPRLAHLQHHVHFAFSHDDASSALSVAHVPGMVEHMLQVIALDLASKYKVQAAGSASGFVFSSTKHEVGDKFVVSVPKDDVATRLAIKALDVFASCPGMEDDSYVASYVVDLSEFVKFVGRR